MTAIELQLDEPTHGELARLAAAAHQPLDAYAAQALREALAAYRDRESLATRSARAGEAAFAAVLAKVPDVDPDPHDRW
jgi:predicted transcriptional regulator